MQPDYDLPLEAQAETAADTMKRIERTMRQPTASAAPLAGAKSVPGVGLARQAGVQGSAGPLSAMGVVAADPRTQAPVAGLAALGAQVGPARVTYQQAQPFFPGARPERTVGVMAQPFDPDAYFGVQASQGPGGRTYGVNVGRGGLGAYGSYNPQRRDVNAGLEYRFNFANGGPVMPSFDPMGNPTGMESIEQEGRAPGAYEAAADRLAAIGAPLARPIATIGEGAREIPGTVADYARDVSASPDPSQRLASDIGKAGSMIAQGIKEDPLGFALDVTPIIGEIRSGMDADKYSRMASEAEAAGDEKKASMFRQLAAVAAAGTAPLAGTAARLAKRGMKAGVEAAEVAARELSPIGLYSVGEDAARALPQEVGTPEQMAAMLAKQGVKPVELEGFKEAFAGQPKVTREEAAAFFKERMPQVEEKVLGVQPKGIPYPEEYQKIEQAIIDKYSPEMAKYHAIYSDRSNEQAVRNEALKNVENLRDKMWAEIDEAIPNREEILKKVNPEQEPTKFGKYTLPGGENYREVLLKLPSDAKAPTFEQWYEKTHIKPLEDYADNPRMMEIFRNKYAAEVENMPKEVSFRSEHWREDPNVIAHLRMSDRVVPSEGFAVQNRRSGNSSETFASKQEAEDYIARLPEGIKKDAVIVSAPGAPKKVLHVEEIQSDWAQKGRKEGFEKPKVDLKPYEADRELARMASVRLAQNMIERVSNGRFDTLTGVLNSGDAELISRMRDAKKTDPELIAANEAFQAADRALQEARKNNRSSIPAAPYVTSTQAWTDLALKRALREAAEGGYDKLVWTPGGEQAKRYSLARQVDSLHYAPSSDGKMFSIEGYKDGENIINKPNIPAERLEEYFGRDVAKKMIEGEKDYASNSGYNVLSGQSLEVGGEGMKGYYDKIVPTQLQKIIKKLDPDAKIGQDLIPVNREGWRISSPEETVSGKWMVKSSDYNSKGLLFDTEAQAQAALAKKLAEEGIEAPSITITPKMREEILKGLPAYAEGGEVSDDDAQDGAEEAYAKGGEAKSKQAQIQRALVSFRKLAAEHNINKPQLAYMIRQKTPDMPRERAALYAQNILSEDILDLSARLENNPQALPVLRDLSERVTKERGDQLMGDLRRALKDRAIRG